MAQEQLLPLPIIAKRKYDNNGIMFLLNLPVGEETLEALNKVTARITSGEAMIVQQRHFNNWGIDNPDATYALIDEAFHADRYEAHIIEVFNPDGSLKPELPQPEK